MTLSTLLMVVAASFLFSVPVLAGDASSNASQNAVPNAIADGPVDMDKVQRYKSLLSEYLTYASASYTHRNALDDVGYCLLTLENLSAEPSDSDDRFTKPFQWNDIIEEWYPPNTVCPTKCSACAAGCNPICCVTPPAAQVSGGSSSSSSKGGSGSGNKGGNTAAGLDPESFVPRFPGIGRPRPIPAFSCPCACQPGCPRSVQAVCCLTPPAIKRPPVVENDDAAAQQLLHGDVDAKAAAPMLDQHIGPLKRIWGRPNLPEACPCACEPTCPAYIQAVCCLTPGTSFKDSDKDGAAPPAGHKSKSGHDTLAMVTETASGDPVSVLAAVNLTVFDSFITMDLLRGLERENEVVRDDETKTFTVTLGVVVGGGPEGNKETTLQQSFQVLDGSLLLEREQILLGLGFMSRIGGITVGKEVLRGLQEGLPIITGTKA